MADSLIIEDDSHTRLGLRLFLEDNGWTVHEAGSLEAARDVANKQESTALPVCSRGRDVLLSKVWLIASLESQVPG